MDGFKHDDDDDNGCHFYPLVTVAKVVDRQTGSEKKRKTTFDNDVDINRVRSLTVWIFFFVCSTLSCFDVLDDDDEK